MQSCPCLRHGFLLQDPQGQVLQNTEGEVQGRLLQVIA